ncbi:MAG: HAMP domain-containing protein, partial [Planctomycetales bacterium]|nr:HAMP domain-containing protein [Planctomycetales bacterium]
MSYRSFKRVLGETNLERKCLILFAACLFLLITTAFWYAEQNAERLVNDKAGLTGEMFLNYSMARHHMLWQVEVSNLRDYDETLRQMITELTTLDYSWEVLVPEGTRTHSTGNEVIRELKNDYERTIYEEIRSRFEKRVRSTPPPASSVVTTVPTDATPVDGAPLENANLDSDSLAANEGQADAESGGESNDANAVNGDGSLAEPSNQLIGAVSYLDTRSKNKIDYYQAIYYHDNCLPCHTEILGDEFLSDSQEVYPALRAPLRVFKVTMPLDVSQPAIMRSRSILLATAIITVFLSVVTLYLVVRYVVVKPLNHLRQISDEISQGNTALRADIHTNDEFEDLAASFNRMLRHLIDTQDELRNVNVDLDVKLDQLAQANMQLHEMNRLKSDFLANMSHELRTPLNSILGFSDVLKGIDTLNDKQKRYVDNIGRSGRILLEMINDVLDLAKMESGRMDVRLTDFKIEVVVNAQCDLVRALSDEKNIDLDVRIESDLPVLHQDQGKVQQILTNLLSNAIKFTPEGGRICVSATRSADDELLLTVEDTGIGIAEE